MLWVGGMTCVAEGGGHFHIIYHRSFVWFLPYRCLWNPLVGYCLELGRLVNCMAIECSTYVCPALPIKCNKGQADGMGHCPVIWGQRMGMWLQLHLESYSLSVGHHSCIECVKLKELLHEL